MVDVAVAEGAATVIFMLCACCERTGRPVCGLLPIRRRALSIAIDRKYHADIQHCSGRARLLALEPPIGREIDLLDLRHTVELIEQGYAFALSALKARAAPTRGGGLDGEPLAAREERAHGAR